MLNPNAYWSLPISRAVVRRALLAPLFALGLVTGAAAQTGNVANGKALFENTAAATGKALPTCTNCHNNVENRRMAIARSNSPFDAISFDEAKGAFGNAITNQADMAPFRGQFTLAQINDIAAYLSDVPKFDKEDGIDLNVAAPNLTATQTLTLTQSQLPSAPLEVLGVAIDAATGASFSIGADACSSQTLPASTACNVTINFRPTSTSGATSFVTYSLRQGTATFTRGVNLVGTVGTQAPPPAPAASSSTGPVTDFGGGGATGLEALLALGLAVAVLARAVRRARLTRSARSSD